MTLIDNVDFTELEAEKFWSFPKSFKGNPKEEAKKFVFSGEYLGARKIDGAYYRFVKDMEGNMVLQGRSRSVKGNFLNKIGHVPHLQSFFNDLPNGTCLLGEVYFPNKEGSQHVTTIMGCLEAKGIDRQEKGDKLHYYVFDVWAYNGKSLLQSTIEERVEILKNIWTKHKNNMNVSCVEFAQYYQGAHLWEVLQKTLINGGEGVVMTKMGTKPEPGKRPARKTLKIKKEISETIDCIFTGKFSAPNRMYDGKELLDWKYWENVQTGEKIEDKKYKEYYAGAPIEPVTKPYFHGWAGSLEIGLVKGDKVVPIGFLSGLTEEIKSDPLKYKGLPIEITCMEILPTGGLRHAKLLKFRPDLTVKDCTWEKVFN